MSVSYDAGRIKRPRATKTEMQSRYEALVEIVREAQPTGVRFAYYRAVSRGLVPKTEAGYVRVQRALMTLRERGEIPWPWIVDSSRWMRKPESWNGVEDFLADAASTYRRELWRNTATIVELWCESESVAGVLYPVTERWDVPLYPIRGQTSGSFAYGAAQLYKHDPRPVVIYYVGDHDPAGYEIEWQLAAKLRQHSGRSDIQFVRLACSASQVDDLGLAGTTPKKKHAVRPDGTRKLWRGPAVEVEAIDAPILRALVEDAIAQHVDPYQLDVLRSVEESERDLLYRLAGDVGS